MPGGAPPPMQMPALQFAKQPDKSMGQQVQGLGDQIAALKGPLQSLMNPQAGPNEAVGTPGSQFAGPVAPGTPVPGAAPPAGVPAATPAATPALPPSVVASPQSSGPSVNDVMRQMPPPMLLDWLKRTAGLGGMQPGLPISAAMQNSGLLPSSGFSPFAGGAPPVPYTGG